MSGDPKHGQETTLYDLKHYSVFSVSVASLITLFFSVSIPSISKRARVTPVFIEGKESDIKVQSDYWPIFLELPI